MSLMNCSGKNLESNSQILIKLEFERYQKICFFLQPSESHGLDECTELIAHLRKLDLEELEHQQMQRRGSFAARRLSLAEVIPDWPQLHKPKPSNKVSN